jgi:DNA repair exonuclease SbcCD ATPase subunit
MGRESVMGMFAKIFIVVNLVLAVVFLGAASTLLGTAEDYKGKLDEVTKQTTAEKKKLNDQIAEFQADNSKYKGEKTLWMNKNEELETRIQRDTVTYTNLTEKFNRAIETNSAYQKSLEGLNGLLENEKKQNGVLAKQCETALSDMRKAKDDADNLRSDNERLMASVKNLQGNLAQAEKENARVIAENAEKSSWIKQIQRRLGVAVTGGIKNMAAVDALVARVDEELNIVLITIGTDDELNIGDTMTVYRGNEYVGKLIIDKKGDDWASGHMDMGLTKTFPQQGDSASTKL